MRRVYMRSRGGKVDAASVAAAIGEMDGTECSDAAAKVGNMGGTEDPPASGSYVGQWYTKFTAGGSMIKSVVWNGTAWVCWLLLAAQAALGAIYPESYGKVFMVEPSTDEAVAALNLVTTYEAAAAVSGLTYTNRALVIVPPGRYNFDTVRRIRLRNFVDLQAERQPTTDFRDLTWNLAPVDSASPIVREAIGSFPTLLYKTKASDYVDATTTNMGCVLLADNVWSAKIGGFAVQNWGTYDPGNTLLEGYFATNQCGLVITNTGGTEFARTNLTEWRNMGFDVYISDHATGSYYRGRLGVAHEPGTSAGGYWLNCAVNDHGWRMCNGTSTYGVWSRCFAGFRGFHGDAIPTTDTAIDCANYGKYFDCVAGNQGFTGCSSGSSPILAGAEFWRCRAGYNSFCISAVFDGKAVDCISGPGSFAGNTQVGAGYMGTIGTNAFLLRCQAGTNSFGSRAYDGEWSVNHSNKRSQYAHPPGSGMGGIWGVIDSCTITNAGPLPLAGGEIRNSTIVNSIDRLSGTTYPAIRLTAFDGQTKIGKITNNKFVGYTDPLTNLVTAVQHDILYYTTGGPGRVGASTEFAPTYSTLMMTNFAVPVVPGSITIRYTVGTVEKIVTDDGSGAFVGDVGTPSGTLDNQINYASGRYGVAFTGTSDAGVSVLARYTTMPLVRVAGNVIGGTNLWSATDDIRGPAAAITNVVTASGANILDPNIK